MTGVGFGANHLDVDLRWPMTMIACVVILLLQVITSHLWSITVGQGAPGSHVAFGHLDRGRTRKHSVQNPGVQARGASLIRWEMSRISPTSSSSTSSIATMPTSVPSARTT